MSIRKFALGAVAAAALAGAPILSSAATIQLGFILDSSGSIGASNWGVITNGLSNAMSLIPTSGSDQYEVTVVSFGTSAATLVLAPTVLTAGNLGMVQTAISNAAFLNSNTNYAVAFAKMQEQLTGSANFSIAGKSYVNFATDGAPNTGGNGVTERNALIAAGIDNISIEGIGTTGTTATFLQNSICYPGPCDTTSPYNFPAQGFYIGVADAAGYAAAIGNKILTVTGQTPEPGSLALVGLALAGFGFARRRFTK